MRILFILDSVENPTSANVLMAQRLAGVLCAAGHTVPLLELWDGLHPHPELPGCTVPCLCGRAPDERRAGKRPQWRFAHSGAAGAALLPPHGGGGGVPPAGAEAAPPHRG